MDERDRRKKSYSDIKENVGTAEQTADPRRSAQKRADKTRKRRKTHKRKTEKMRIEMRQAPKRKRRRPSSRSSTAFEVFYKILLVSAILCAVLFMVTVFFEIKDIDIEGNERYNSAEIINASGISEGDKLFFINRFDAENGVLTKLPYIDEVKIKMRPPTKLVIEVKESEAAVCLQNGGMTYLISENCRLLEFYPTDDRMIMLPIIKCSEIAEPVAGKEIVFKESYMLQALKDVMQYILDDEIATKVTDLNIEKLYDINFVYDNRLKIVIGDSTEIKKKILYLKTVMQDIGEDEKGTVNVKNPERTIFRPSTAEVEK